LNLSSKLSNAILPIYYIGIYKIFDNTDLGTISPKPVPDDKSIIAYIFDIIISISIDLLASIYHNNKWIPDNPASIWICGITLCSSI